MRKYRRMMKAVVSASQTSLTKTVRYEDNYWGNVSKGSSEKDVENLLPQGGIRKTMIREINKNVYIVTFTHQNHSDDGCKARRNRGIRDESNGCAVVVTRLFFSLKKSTLETDSLIGVFDRICAVSQSNPFEGGDNFESRMIPMLL